MASMTRQRLGLLASDDPAPGTGRGLRHLWRCPGFVVQFGIYHTKYGIKNP